MACMDAVGVPHGREPIQLPRKTSGILELFVNGAVRVRKVCGEPEPTRAQYVDGVAGHRL